MIDLIRFPSNRALRTPTIVTILAAIRKSQARDPASHIFGTDQMTKTVADGRTYHNARAETLHVEHTRIEIELISH
jgi:hypothetical protein